MKKTIYVLTLIFFLLTIQNGSAQSPIDQQIDKAVGMMDNGLIDNSIEILKYALKDNPKHYRANYELGYALYQKQDYKGAIKILKKLTGHLEADGILYQLLGNSYDMNGQPDKAISTYHKGLKQFPNSGMLYLELGTMQLKGENFDQAIRFYEQGIELDPAFPSNYHRAALLFCGSSESVWGMIYGELFLNLERGSDRNPAISKVLFDTYKKNIQIKADGSLLVSFSRNHAIDPEELKKGNIRAIPFGMAIYEGTTADAFVKEHAETPVTEINLASLGRIRSRFVDQYFDEKTQRATFFPNVLFEYQKKIKEAGHLEAYNYWILRGGDEKGFNEWLGANPEKWRDFLAWFKANPLKLDANHKFYRMQYSK